MDRPAALDLARIWRYDGGQLTMIAALITLYVVALLGVTVVVRRRQRDRGARSFFVADGQLSTLVTACSLAATSVGGSATVVSAAIVGRHGLAGIWLDLGGVAGFVALGLFIARRVRDTEVASIAELAGLRYGLSVRRVTAVLVLVVEIAWLALLSKAAASVLQPALPALSHAQLVTASLVVVVAYTALGGQYAVSYTDVLQMAVMLCGLCLVAPVALARRLTSAGLTALPLHFPTSPTLGWSRVGGFVLLNGLPHAVGSDIYAKVLSARDSLAAARGALIAALIKLLIAAAMAFVALAGSRLLPGVRPDELLGAVVHGLLPAVLGALLLLALLATMMSSADQVLLSAVTVTCHDLLCSHRPAPRHLSAVGYGLAAALLAVAVPTVVELMQVGYTVFVTALALPVLACCWPRLPLARRGVSLAMAVGALVGGGLHAARLAGRFGGEPVFWGLAVNLALLVASALADRSRSRAS